MHGGKLETPLISPSSPRYFQFLLFKVTIFLHGTPPFLRVLYRPIATGLLPVTAIRNLYNLYKVNFLFYPFQANRTWKAEKTGFTYKDKYCNLDWHCGNMPCLDNTNMHAQYLHAKNLRQKARVESVSKCVCSTFANMQY
jgi:hypothetical protein